MLVSHPPVCVRELINFRIPMFLLHAAAVEARNHPAPKPCIFRTYFEEQEAMWCSRSSIYGRPRPMNAPAHHSLSTSSTTIISACPCLFLLISVCLHDCNTATMPLHRGRQQHSAADSETRSVAGSDSKPPAGWSRRMSDARGSKRLVNARRLFTKT